MVIAVIIQVKAFSCSGLQLIGQLLTDAAEEMGSVTEYDQIRTVPLIVISNDQRTTSSGCQTSPNI